MSTKDVNDIVHRLATDMDFWNQFHSNPDQALAGYGLTPAERASLEAIPRENLRISAAQANFGQPAGDDPRTGMVPCNAVQPAGGDLLAGTLPYDPEQPLARTHHIVEVIAPSDLVGVIAPSDLSELPHSPHGPGELSPPPGGMNVAKQPRSMSFQTVALSGALAVFALIICAALGFGPAREQLERLVNPPVNVEQVRPRDPLATEGHTEAPVLPTEDDPTPVRPVEVAVGACGDNCNPAAPACLAGLSCLLKTPGGTDYMCWNSVICATTVTESANPSVTEVVSTEAAQECGAGWLPSGGCVCCGSSLVCADGTVAQFNPACTGGETGGQPPVCGDGICNEPVCSCSADCGPC